MRQVRVGPLERQIGLVRFRHGRNPLRRFGRLRAVAMLHRVDWREPAHLHLPPAFMFPYRFVAQTADAMVVILLAQNAYERLPPRFLLPNLFKFQTFKEMAQLLLGRKFIKNLSIDYAQQFAVGKDNELC